MIESILPREGLPGPSSAPNADPIHGHEWDPSKATRTPSADLQYACVFDLGSPKVCPMGRSDCDCPPEDVQAGIQNPLCQGAAGTQTRAKAYPGTRELQVLQGLGEQAIVASVCPSNLSDETKADYGYRPAIAAIIERLRNPLRGCVFVQ
jgi:hypothetical protein